MKPEHSHYVGRDEHLHRTPVSPGLQKGRIERAKTALQAARRDLYRAALDENDPSQKALLKTAAETTNEVLTDVGSWHAHD